MDTRITQLYLYEKCYPLFKSLCTRWHIDCKDCVEFIDVIYLYLMTPNEKTGRCYLETFDFRCSFKCWLMTVSIYYCRLLYRKDMNVVDIDGSEQDEKKNHRSDVSPIGCEVREIDESYDKDYVAKLLSLMKNPK